MNPSAQVLAKPGSKTSSDDTPVSIDIFQSSARPQDENDQHDYPVEAIERIYRKLDWRIIPPFWILYFLCSAIRSNIGIAQTMNRDQKHNLGTVLGLSSRDVSTALALFYVSYVVFDFPSNLVMSKLSPRVWMARIVFATGLVGACFAAIEHAWSLKLLRFLLGLVVAGVWPGMAFYLTLFYPPSRTGKRIGMYFTAAQVSAAVASLVSAAFQLMDGVGGLTGFRWMFLVYGLVTIVLSFVLLWWLPEQPLAPNQERQVSAWLRWLPATPEPLTGRDAVMHYHDLTRVYNARPWTLKDLGWTMLDWRLWPLCLMYFGVVGVGIGTQLYGTVIIAAIRPQASDIQVSLLFAPVWIMDLIAILILVPISDRFHHHRAFFFAGAACVQIAGLLTMTFAVDNGWARYGGMLMVGFGLGPTVPTCMAWTSEVFQRRHGQVGVAAATALVSGLGNMGSVTTTYALYTGWAEDAKPGKHQFRMSNLTMIGILAMSIASALVMKALLSIVGNEPSSRLGKAGAIEDGAARREVQQRGFENLGRRGRNQVS
ncbi:hypothetical protein CDD82_4201 [Ophiocordyceps australis]|uniref:Major facilitator superfamily (MFS) profile domain-containing protein n=1 Tax=Ophiocordyceps australis TaxID=1399860 RepID=A0A2C5Z985_9HYPO|nr:hypothetical protein CDD82_4201 [Ophiocordyceps australis]